MVVLRPDEELRELESLSLTIKSMFCKREKVPVSNLFHNVPGGVKLLHIIIGNFKTKIADIKNDDIFQNADIIALNETHL